MRFLTNGICGLEFYKLQPIKTRLQEARSPVIKIMSEIYVENGMIGCIYIIFAKYHFDDLNVYVLLESISKIYYANNNSNSRNFIIDSL